MVPSYVVPQTGTKYCRTHNVSVCLYIAYLACGSTSLYIKTLYFFLTVLSLSAAAPVANIKIRYDAKTPQFAIFGTRVIYVFYSNQNTPYLRSYGHFQMTLFDQRVNIKIIFSFYSIYITYVFRSEDLTPE